MTELEVPDVVMHRLNRFTALSEMIGDDKARAAVRAIAAPVVAAELRRLAGDMHQPWDALVLRRRADLIEGGFS